MCDPRDLNRRSASAVVGLLGACPAGAQCIAAGNTRLSTPPFFLKRAVRVRFSYFSSAPQIGFSL